MSVDCTTWKIERQLKQVVTLAYLPDFRLDVNRVAEKINLAIYPRMIITDAGGPSLEFNRIENKLKTLATI